ncbi:hypothetical protein ACEUZ9_000320 [Paracoccus litorisediminis]|uniref:hypothetical protein n=1 Tax=Paracoccus litorisediminis TaxID=2006130 RepID=UPI0037328957
MTLAKTVLLAIAGATLAGPAMAFHAMPTALPAGLGIEAGASTLGAYIAPTYKHDDRLGFRSPVYLGSYSIDDQFEGNDASFDIDVKSVSVLADWRPFHGNFKVSGGLAFGGYEAVAGISDPELDGISFTGKYDFKFRQKSNIVPVLSMGYDVPLGEKLSLSSELGAKLAQYEVSTDLGAIADPLVRADMESELDKINDDLGDFKATPFLSLGLAYRF